LGGKSSLGAARGCWGGKGKRGGWRQGSGQCLEQGSGKNHLSKGARKADRRREKRVVYELKSQILKTAKTADELN